MSTNPPRRRVRRILVLIVAALTLVELLSAFGRPLMWKRWLMATCSGADRVVLDLNDVPEKTRRAAGMPELPTVTVDGSDKARELLDAIRFSPCWLGGHCMCFGEMNLRFYKGDRELLSLSYHHRQSLRHGYEMSDHNMDLTAASRTGVDRWLAENGGAKLESAQVEAARLMGEWREKRDEETPTSGPTTQSSSSKPSTTQP